MLKQHLILPLQLTRQITLFVISEVLRERLPKDRAALFSHFIRVAHVWLFPLDLFSATIANIISPFVSQSYGFVVLQPSWVLLLFWLQAGLRFVVSLAMDRFMYLRNCCFDHIEFDMRATLFVLPILVFWFQSQGCYKCSNFNALKAILAALHSAPLWRLKMSWVVCPGGQWGRHCGVVVCFSLVEVMSCCAFVHIRNDRKNFAVWYTRNSRQRTPFSFKR